MKKPKAKVIGNDGNVFALISICTKSLRNNGNSVDEIKKFTDEVYSAKSYDEALKIMSNYCELI